MDSFNFSALVLHPNTETALIEKRNFLLKEQFKNYIPLFPLYGILDEAEYSSDLKKKYSKPAKSEISGFFSKEHILFFYGQLSLENDNVPFIIPSAIEKKTDSKDLLSVFNSGLKSLKELNLASIELFSSELSFKSFQIADCRLSKNQYSIYESFWTKSIT